MIRLIRKVLFAKASMEDAIIKPLLTFLFFGVVYWVVTELVKIFQEV